MPLTLEYTGQTAVPVEVEGLTPDALRGLTADAIRQLPIQHGNQTVAVAELFRVSGSAADERLAFCGDLSGVHWIGAKMQSGTLHVDGNAGRHVGSEMLGGRIDVAGDASDLLGAEMHGGLIHVRGHAGDLVGAAYRGSRRGMTGGTLLVDGNTGQETAHSMRRGLIAVGGSAGDNTAFNMIAGTLLVFGRLGIRPAAGMRRGTICVLGSDSPDLLPTFRFACRYQPDFLRMYLTQLRRLGFAVLEDLFHADFLRYSGDLLTVGKGELLVRA